MKACQNGVNNLHKKNIDAQYVSSCQEALSVVKAMIPYPSGSNPKAKGAPR